MKPRFSQFKQSVSGRLSALRGDATQAGKRWLTRLGIVPPPFRISLDITDACNLRCPTCAKGEGTEPTREMSLRQWQRALAKIKGVARYNELAVSGGEPFTRPDVMDILAYAKQNGFRIVIISNGQALDEEVMNRLSEIGVYTLTLSLNSLSPDVHDSSRGMPGNHARVMALIDHWRRHPLSMQLNLSTVVMQCNAEELTAMAFFVGDRGLTGILFQALLPVETHYALAGRQSMAPVSESWFQNNPFWIRHPEVLSKQIRMLLKLQRRGVPILNPPSQLKRFPRYFQSPERVSDWLCIGVQNRIYIDPAGDMRLCYGFPVLGNILEHDPKFLWRSQAAKSIRREAKSCSRPCRLQNCNL